MTTKTINCAECDVEFTFEENTRFPRKYCLNCSAQKKASFKTNMKAIEDAEPPIVHEKIPPKETGFHYPKKDNGFEAHLSIESVRSNALASAIGECESHEKQFTTEGLLGLAKQFEKYILTGE